MSKTRIKLAAAPRFELLYKQDHIIIPILKGQTSRLIEFLAVGEGLNLEKEYDLELKPVRKGRSLDANAYYHVLAIKCANKLGIPFAEYHNRNLAEIGIPWTDKDGSRHWILQKDNDFWLKQIEIHFCPTDRTEMRNGVAYRWYYLLKPSHLFDTKEMSILIDSVVQDANGLGIETLTENERRRLEEAWKCGNH